METVDTPINLAAILLVGMGVAVLLSLITLAFYFFGGYSPVERHVHGRVEANINPAEVLAANRQFRNQRLAATLLGVFLLWFFMHQAAPAQTEQATASFFEAISVTVSVARDAVVRVAQELGIGNECECADPSRIGGNGP